MAEVHDLNTTDANNTGRFPESQAPSTLNNGGRALEGMIARFFSDLQGPNLPVATLSGSVIQFTANRVSITLTGTTSNYTGGLMFGFWMGSNANVSGTSIRINNIQSLSLRNNRGQSLSASAILAGSYNLVVKDDTNNYFRLLLTSSFSVPEEGTFTPADASGAGLSLTISQATYTKIGTRLFVDIDVTYPATADASASLMSGLPYTLANVASNPGTGALRISTITNPTFLRGVLNTANFRAFQYNGNMANSALSTLNLIGSATFQTAS